MAVGVEEINAFENGVIGHTHHLNARSHQAVFGFFQRFHAVHLERNVLHPIGGIGIAPHGG